VWSSTLSGASTNEDGVGASVFFRTPSRWSTSNWVDREHGGVGFGISRKATEVEALVGVIEAVVELLELDRLSGNVVF